MTHHTASLIPLSGIESESRQNKVSWWVSTMGFSRSWILSHWCWVTQLSLRKVKSALWNSLLIYLKGEKVLGILLFIQTAYQLLGGFLRFIIWQSISPQNAPIQSKQSARRIICIHMGIAIRVYQKCDWIHPKLYSDIFCTRLSHLKCHRIRRSARDSSSNLFIYFK